MTAIQEWTSNILCIVVVITYFYGYYRVEVQGRPLPLPLWLKRYLSMHPDEELRKGFWARRKHRKLREAKSVLFDKMTEGVPEMEHFREAFIELTSEVDHEGTDWSKRDLELLMRQMEKTREEHLRRLRTDYSERSRRQIEYIRLSLGLKNEDEQDGED